MLLGVGVCVVYTVKVLAKKKYQFPVSLFFLVFFCAIFFQLPFFKVFLERNN